MTERKKTEKSFNLKRTLYENLVDTGFATIINIPINYVLLAAILKMNVSPMVGTLIMTGIFFAIGICRKTYIRYVFWKGEKNS